MGEQWRDWRELLATVLGLALFPGAVLLLPYALGISFIEFWRTAFGVFALGFVVPAICAGAFMAGLAICKQDSHIKKAFGSATMACSLVIGLWAYAQAQPDIDPAECPAGPRYC